MDNKKQYKVATFKVGQTKNGKEMWRIGLQELGSENILTGVIWSEDIPRFDGTKFRVGNTITFLGQDYNSNYNSVVIKNVTVIKEALKELPQSLACKYSKELEDFLKGIIDSNSDETGVKTLLAKDILHYIQEDAFKLTPAAVVHHHNYLGGLLQHTYEVFTITASLVDRFPYDLDKENILMAAIAHDIGKIFEYDTDIKLGTAIVDEDWLNREYSHLNWGSRMAHDVGATEVARMIASHHGKVEWGALFEPKTPAENLLHLADMLSANIGITTIDKLEKVVEAITKKETPKAVPPMEFKSNIL